MSNDVLPRIVPPSEPSDIFTSAAWVLSVPRIRPDAVAVFGCLELQTRVHAIARWRASGAGQLLFAGINPNEKKSFDALTLERLRQDPYDLSADELARTVTQVETENTKTQAQWLVQEADVRHLRVVELHASPYHIVRAYLTVLAAMDHRDKRFLLIPYPTPTPPGYPVPETGVVVADMTTGEYARIVKYRSGGDVASLAQLNEYLSWMWRQPEFEEFPVQ